MRCSFSAGELFIPSTLLPQDDAHPAWSMIEKRTAIPIAVKMRFFRLSSPCSKHHHLVARRIRQSGAVASEARHRFVPRGQAQRGPGRPENRCDFNHRGHRDAQREFCLCELCALGGENQPTGAADAASLRSLSSASRKRCRASLATALQIQAPATEVAAKTPTDPRCRKSGSGDRKRGRFGDTLDWAIMVVFCSSAGPGLAGKNVDSCDESRKMCLSQRAQRRGWKAKHQYHPKSLCIWGGGQTHRPILRASAPQGHPPVSA